MKKEKARLSLRKEAFKKMEQMHPHEVLVYVSMIGSTVIFFFTILAFTVSRPLEASFFKFEFPKSFIVSTVVLHFVTVPTCTYAQDKAAIGNDI